MNLIVVVIDLQTRLGTSCDKYSMHMRLGKLWVVHKERWMFVHDHVVGYGFSFKVLPCFPWPLTLDSLWLVLSSMSDSPWHIYPGGLPPEYIFIYSYIFIYDTYIDMYIILYIMYIYFIFIIHVYIYIKLLSILILVC